LVIQIIKIIDKQDINLHLHSQEVKVVFQNLIQHLVEIKVEVVSLVQNHLQVVHRPHQALVVALMVVK